MTPEQLELARRLVEAEWWEWRRGMGAMEAVGSAVYVWGVVEQEDLDSDDAVLGDHCVPDLTDWATGGVLLDLVGEWNISVDRLPDGWSVGLVGWPERGEARDWDGATIAEACAKALLDLKG